MSDTASEIGLPRAVRRELPEERQAITHKFDIQGHEGYITVGLYEDGTPGEIFLVMTKDGSAVAGFADAFAQAISYALQYGVPLPVLVDRFSHMRFEPSGMTKNPRIRFAKSIIDYVFRWMATKFLPVGDQIAVGVSALEADQPKGVELPLAVAGTQSECPNCGRGTFPRSNGYSRCSNCGYESR